jgi:hypothetical protein
MRVVLAAIRAELLHFKTLGCRLFVFGARVVPVLAFLTLERDNFSRHLINLFANWTCGYQPRYRTRGYQPRSF